MIKDWVPHYTQKDVRIVQESEAYPGYLSVKKYQIQFRLFDGGVSHVVHRELLIRPPAAAVLLYDSKLDQVVMIEQLRMGALQEESPWILELVAGVVDEGEIPESTAHREAEEEAGCQLLSLIPICTYHVSPGISTEKTAVFCGIVDSPRGGTFHGLVQDGEDIKVHVLKRETAYQWMTEGKITSASAIIALQWLQLNYKRT